MNAHIASIQPNSKPMYAAPYADQSMSDLSVLSGPHDKESKPSLFSGSKESMHTPTHHVLNSDASPHTFSDISSVKPRRIDFIARNKQKVNELHKDRAPLQTVQVQSTRKSVALKSNDLFAKYPLRKSKENVKPIRDLAKAINIKSKSDLVSQMPSMRVAPQPHEPEPIPTASVSMLESERSPQFHQ